MGMALPAGLVPHLDRHSRLLVAKHPKTSGFSIPNCRTGERLSGVYKYAGALLCSDGSALRAYRHTKNPELFRRNSHIGTRSLFKYFVMAVFIAPIMLYGALGYEGGAPSIRPTDLFYTSGPAFIAMNVTGWWASGVYSFGLVILACLYIERLLGRYRRRM